MILAVVLGLSYCAAVGITAAYLGPSTGNDWGPAFMAAAFWPIVLPAAIGHRLMCKRMKWDEKKRLPEAVAREVE